MRWFALVLLLGFAPQDDVTLKWGLGAAEAADYEVFDSSRGRPRPLPDSSFLIFGSELTGETNTLIINDYRDLARFMLFQLPPKAVGKKSRWTYERDFFVDGRRALTKMHAYKPIRMAGQLRVRKFEKVNDVDCVAVEGQFQYFEVRFDQNDVPKVERRPLGTLSTMQWLSVQDTLLVKGAFAYKGKGEEFQGIKQGEQPKQTKLKLAEQIVLKPERLKVEALANLDSIHDAIKKGVEWLKTQQERAGAWVDKGGSFARDFPVGSTGLCVSALLHSGVKKDDPIVQRAFAWMQKQAFKKCYDVAAMIMAFETKYLPLERFDDLENFTEEDARKAIQSAITPQDKAFVERAVKWLIEKQTEDGTWGYPEQSEKYDHSNTQYAMLGLKSAARCGVKIPSKVWKKAAEHWCDSQRVKGPKVALKIEYLRDADEKKDDGDTQAEKPEEVDQGPWGYFVKEWDPSAKGIDDQGYGSMTCAGLTSLIIAESELIAQKDLDDKLKKRIDSAKKQGLAWLQHNYSVRGNLPSAGFWSVVYYYYLYSLERVGVLYGIRKIADHDWYQEGAMLLVRAQRRDGSWKDYEDIPVLDTAFALLFLKKATVPVSTGAPKKK